MNSTEQKQDPTNEAYNPVFNISQSEPSLEGNSAVEIIQRFIDYYKNYDDTCIGLMVSESAKEYNPANKTLKSEYNVTNLKLRKYAAKEVKIGSKALQDYLNTPGKKLCDFIVEKQNILKIKPSQIYNSVFMNKQVYSRIIRNQVKFPDFESCVQLIFGLHLNIEDANELLRLAGRAFSDDEYHKIVKFHIENKDYNITNLNNNLWNNGIDKAIGCAR